MFRYLKIYVNQKIDLQGLAETLTSFGFKRSAAVSEGGDFAIRGGILDIFLPDFEEPVRIELEDDLVISITSFSLQDYEVTETHSAIIVLPGEGFGQRRKTPVSISEDVPLDNFVDIAPNDLVVHVDYGIGRFLGFEKIEQKGAILDHMVLEYADGDKLYIPIDNMHLVQKYVGFEGKRPLLTKLGTKLWHRAKNTARRGAVKEALELLRVEALRRARRAAPFSKDTDWQIELEKGFQYEETPDQDKAIKEAKQDMENPYPMDRLLCGDVGYGKTEVALRAAFKAVMNNKQVAVLVPTTILAEQHFKIFNDRMRGYPVNIEMLSRFRSETQQRAIIEGIANGSIDIIIGTHRLLSDDVLFRELGLLIIDEEQRFGVKHKEKLKRLRSSVYVLTLTATPIPRTLYLALMGAKDISIISTPPPNRLPIESHLIEYDLDIIKDAVLRELRRKGQVYFVHNRIKNIDKVARDLKCHINEARFAVAHGQMSSKELEEVMLNFIEGRIDVLITTNIIGSGLDIPNANTIFINRSDAFGLSELYQLKGRVGRFNVKAYAYFIIPKGAILTEDSRKRLTAIESHKDLGAGFKIAMEDMKLRGAGNILGYEQHGYINLVGFDLYCRLLREAIRSLKASGGV